ncbi:MAG: beta-ketoacyl synthase chain length factor [Myxococcota bacterium]|nr:beta-ketoacyl synthase chain length factor [Myxococcota bacterium]
MKGLGLWTPGFGSADAWCGGKPDPEITKPDATLLKGALKRRSSELTQIAVEVYNQATLQAGRSPSSIPSVWATAHGEHSTALRLLGMMHEGEGKVSPTSFHNSVHNTPGGYASISTSNILPSTTLTGGSEIVSAAIIEAICMAESLEQDTVVVLADEALKEPFDLPGAHTPLGVGLCFGHSPENALAEIFDFRHDALPLKPDPHFGRLHVSAVLPLLERIVHHHSGRVALELEGEKPRQVLSVDVNPIAD